MGQALVKAADGTMTPTMTIRTNNVPRLIIDWDQLTAEEKKEFDYITADTCIGRDFIRYRGVTYDLHEFMAVSRTIAPHCQRPGWEYWDGYSSDSFFSGVLVKYCGDDRVIMATYYC